MSQQTEYIVLTFRAYSDDGQYVAECLELGTASQGDTPDQAIEMAYEAASMYLESADELGELPRIFRERSVQVLHAVPVEIEIHANVHPDDVVKPIVYTLKRRDAVTA